MMNHPWSSPVLSKGPNKCKKKKKNSLGNSKLKAQVIQQKITSSRSFKVYFLLFML